ncbi:MAG: deoxyribodipyrimidine photo-lyase [Thiotrichales bacterium]|nr:deoxyribodipyrimidine photo-lyase [Thiotrichales bacterium]
MTTLVWLQREFRLDYLTALNEALNKNDDIILAYFHDPEKSIGAANRVWLAHALETLTTDVAKRNGKLWIVSGNFADTFPKLLKDESIDQVYYTFQVGEPFTSMQQQAQDTCKALHVRLKPFFSEFWLKPTDFSNQQNRPYLVFTPFYNGLLKQQNHIQPLARLAKETLAQTASKACPAHYRTLPDDLRQLKQQPWAQKIMAASQVGETPTWQILSDFITEKLQDYSNDRDFPAYNATSNLSTAIHFGHIPTRQLYFELQALIQSDANIAPAARAWLRQLAWREFARHLLYWFPQTQTTPFQEKYQQMLWRDETDHDSKILIEKWQSGLTGIPIIDAGMRELWATGIMHNRVRMLVASFLTKNLNFHWLIGQHWFEETLLDADPANNIMGWQWVAGCGVDAAPYYRLFNPAVQSEKFDADGDYLRHWLPELSTLSKKAIHQPWKHESECVEKGIFLGKTYPHPIVNLEESRKAHMERVQMMKKTAQPDNF